MWDPELQTLFISSLNVHVILNSVPFSPISNCPFVLTVQQCCQAESRVATYRQKINGFCWALIRTRNIRNVPIPTAFIVTFYDYRCSLLKTFQWLPLPSECIQRPCHGVQGLWLRPLRAPGLTASAWHLTPSPDQPQGHRSFT